jgi:opacity protein-like surface antigen
MYKFCFSLLIAFISFHSTVFSQRITLGISSGLNFSDINNSSVAGKWQSMTGPVNGIFINFKINRFFEVNSEINYLSLYYHYKTYYNYWYYPYPDMYPNYYNPRQDWNFSYLRFPLSVSLRTPTLLSFYISAGAYYAKLLSDNSPYYAEEIPDFEYGYLVANGISYNLKNKVKLNFEIRYTKGNKVVIQQDNGQNAALEFSLGLGYIFPSKSDKNFYPDTLNPVWSVKYSVGSLIGQNVGSNKNHYKPGFGFMAGLSLVYSKSKSVSFQTDIQFQRKSYYLNDSSSSYFIFKPSVDNFFVDNKIDIDYLNIPVFINFRFGNEVRFYSGFGFYGAIRMNARVVGYAYKETRNQNSYLSEKIHVYDNIEGEFENSDFGWLLNLGIETPVFSKYKLDLNLRYNSSFQNIYKGIGNNSIRLNSLSLSAGIIIPVI